LKLKSVIKKAKANGKGTKKYLKKYKILSEISKVLDSLKEHYLNLTLVNKKLKYSISKIADLDVLAAKAKKKKDKRKMSKLKFEQVKEKKKLKLLKASYSRTKQGISKRNKQYKKLKAVYKAA
jgi:hypothetical protein